MEEVLKLFSIELPIVFWICPNANNLRSGWIINWTILALFTFPFSSLSVTTRSSDTPRVDVWSGFKQDVQCSMKCVLSLQSIATGFRQDTTFIDCQSTYGTERISLEAFLQGWNWMYQNHSFVLNMCFIVKGKVSQEEPWDF